MAVQVATLDILVNQAGFDPKVARAIGEAITVEIGAALDGLATKQDLTQLRHDMQGDIAGVNRTIESVRLELKNDITQMRSEFKEHVAQVRSELKEDIAQVRSELKESEARLRAELRESNAKLRAEFKEDQARLRAEFKEDQARLRTEFKEGQANLRAELKEDMGKLRSELTRHIYFAILGQMAVYLGIAYFFVTQMLPRG